MGCRHRKDSRWRWQECNRIKPENIERTAQKWFSRSLEKIGGKNYEKYDEVPKKMIFSRTVKGLSNSMEENIAQLQFRYLEDKANAGESFVVVGRCAETMLKYSIGG